MKFGVTLPTCTEGLVYPLPFGDHRDLLTLAREAEDLGFDSVLVNDHLSTQAYVRRMFADPPRYYEPLMTLAWIASQTTRIRLMTGVVVLPVRDPVLLAKQVTTLDHMSDGRLTLGVGVGAYREEFEAVRPQLRTASRAHVMSESLQALRLLFTERRADMDGDHVQFSDIEMHPKPIQSPLPIYSSGNAEGTLRRAAAYCDGWMPAGLTMARLGAGITQLRGYAAEAGRDPRTLAIAPQMVICLAPTRDRAAELFQSSQVHEHLVSLQQSTLQGMAVDSYVESNLIGTPDDVCAHITELQALGVTELAGLIVIGSTPQELVAQMRMISDEVTPAFVVGR